eukprot:3085066-Prymnesium_polylepis.1
MSMSMSMSMARVHTQLTSSLEARPSLRLRLRAAFEPRAACIPTPVRPQAPRWDEELAFRGVTLGDVLGQPLRLA